MFKKIAGGMLAVAGMGLIFAAPAEAKVKEVHKSYVCKYVGTPGVDERLQGGDNPIYVDNHSIAGKDVVKVGDKFSDKHGRSVVIVANTPKLSPEPGVEQCPAPQGPPPTTTTTPSSTTTTSTTTKPTAPTETKTQPPTSTTTTPSGTTTVPSVTEPPVTETTGAPTTKPTVVVTDPRPSVTLPTEAPKPTKTSEIVVSTPDVTTTDAPHTTAVDTPHQQELAFTGTKMLYAIAGLILLAAGVLLLFVRRGLTLSRK